MAPDTTKTAVTEELSEEARKRVAWFMDRTLQSLSSLAGQKVKLLCGHSITRKVLKELPDATLSWTFNTEPLAMDPSRIFFYKENLDITDLVPQDSGVYTCVVSWGAEDTVKENLTLGVFSLEVETEGASRYVFEQEPVEMDCHSVSLGELFPDAVRYWLFNGTHTPALPVTKASNRTCDVIRAANKSMSGVWECQVLQQRTERVWASAWYNLSVQEAPSSADRMFRHLQDNQYTVIVVLSVLLLILLLLFCFSAVKLRKIQDDADERFRDEREGWEETLIKHGVDGKIDLNRLTPPASPGHSEPPASPGDSEPPASPSHSADDNTNNLMNFGQEGAHGESEPKVSKPDDKGEQQEKEVPTQVRTGTSRGDFTWNKAYAHNYRKIRTPSNKLGDDYGEIKTAELVRSVMESEIKETFNMTVGDSKQALKIGRNLLTKHTNKELPLANSNDALLWLHCHSKMAKSKGWGLYLKKHLPSHFEVGKTQFSKQHTSRLLEEDEQSHTFNIRNDLNDDQDKSACKRYSIKNIFPEINEGLSHSMSSNFPQPRDNPEMETNAWGQPFTEVEPEAEPPMGCLKDSGDHNTTENTTRNISRPLKKIQCEDIALDRQRVHNIRVLHWKKWLRSKLPLGAEHSHAWSSRTFPWNKNEIIYTALPQNDNDNP